MCLSCDVYNFGENDDKTAISIKTVFPTNLLIVHQPAWKYFCLVAECCLLSKMSAISEEIVSVGQEVTIHMAKELHEFILNK